MKKAVAALLTTAMVLSLGTVAFASETEAEASTEAETEVENFIEGKKIGVSLWGFDNQYFVNLRDGAQKRADELGAELVIADPHENVSQQVSDVENLINMKVDAIILSAIDANSLEAVSKEAMDAGIPVVAQSIELKNCDVYSSADEYSMGYQVGQGAGQWIADNYGEDAEIQCAVLFNSSNSACLPRGKGLEEGILSIAKNAKVDASQDASTTADGQSVTDALLQANPDLQVIVCQNDSVALGALSAVQAAGKDTKDFYIGGMDNTDEAVQKIKDGTALRATLDNLPYDNGIADVDLCNMLIGGLDVNPRYVVETSLVTADDLK